MFRTRILFGAFLLVALPGIVVAEGTGAQERMKEALELFREGGFEEALEILDAVGRDLPADAGEESKRLRGELNFTRGYICQRKAACVGADERVRLFGKARDSYQKLLADYPGNAQASTNLAMLLESLGRWNEAVPILQKAAQLNSDREYEYHIAMGDLYRRHERSENAIALYELAAKRDSSKRTAYERILSTKRRLGPQQANQLLSLAARIEEARQPELAAEAFSAVVWLTYKDETRLAVNACQRWADVMAGCERLGRSELTLLPSPPEWEHDCIRQLHALVSGPATATNHFQWWLEDGQLYRRHISASILRLRAREALAKENAQEAMEILELGLELAPPVDSYKDPPIKNKPWIFLEIARDLARVYSRLMDKEVKDLPRVNRLSEKFRSLEKKIYGPKGDAIMRGDYPAMQKFHTTLGFIYAEREQWNSTGVANNGIFQLDHAIDAADKWYERRNGPFQPLPRLKRLLAEGLAHEKRFADATGQYVAAAEAFLDTDDLNGAAASVAAADSLKEEHPRVGAFPRLDDLREILETRKRISTAQTTIAEIQSTGAVVVSAWPGRFKNLAPDFVARQRFKTLSDLGDAARQRNSEEVALGLMSRALEASLGTQVMTSYGDLQRLRESESAIRAQVDLGNAESRVETKSGAGKSAYPFEAAKTWHIPGGSSESTKVTAVSQDLVLAEKVIREANAQPWGIDQRVPISVKKGRVTVHYAGGEGPKTVQERRMLDSIRRIHGVKKVEVEPPRRWKAQP